VADATKTLEGAGLTVDKSRNTKDYSDDIPKGNVIGIVHGKNVRVGSTVGLNISRGPELVAVPDVSGMKLEDAMNKLREAGLEPWTALDLGKLFKKARADGTDPAAGERVPKGSRVQVMWSLSG